MPPHASDIVVVGHGAAGLAAALAAAEEARALASGTSITLIEACAEGEHGGNTRWSPSYMRLASTDALAPGFEDDIQAASGGRADPRYTRRLATEAVPTIAWLERHGIRFHRPVYYLSAGPPRIQPVGGGAALLAELTRAVRAAGVACRYACEAQALVLNDRSELRGVRVRDAAGRTSTLDASAVILASGGFEGNGDMLRRYLGAGAESLKPISPGTVHNTGAGIRMAIDAGARRAGDWNGMHAEPVDPRSPNSAPVVLVYPYGIVVDRDGRRFFDEGAGLVHETWEAFARRIHFEAKDRIAFAILDSALLAIDGHERAIRSEVPPYRADSLDRLAALCGIARDGLLATVAAYNAAARGDRTRFDATRADGLAADASLYPPKSNWARPLDHPPYLAYPLVGAIAYTFGGVATDEHAQVLGEHGPIAGLYAAGEISGHFYGLAPNAVAILRALAFGRIAGKQAARHACR